MKNVLIIALGLLLAGSVVQAQNQSPNTRQSNPVKPQVKPVNPNQNREVPRDTARRTGQRLRPDSLRRGGAVKVDTIR